MCKEKFSLHVCNLDKFIPPFIEFSRENFSKGENFFYLIGDKERFPYSEGEDTFQQTRKYEYIKLLKRMYQAERIILHGLFDFYVVFLLACNPWLLKKCYWVLWGGDLYCFKYNKNNFKWMLKELFRRPVIRNIEYITTTVPGDFFLAKQWYNTRAKFIENLMYKSHLARRVNDEVKPLKEEEIKIQIGNSADPSNNHFEIIDLLSKIKDMNYSVYCPLSYGDSHYRDEVISYGKRKIGDKFFPMTEFMSFDAYTEYMQSLDIAIFNHRRQQAMGNMIGFLSLGKKVYLRSDVTPYKYFKEKGLSVFKSDNFGEIEKLPEDKKVANIQICEREFSEDKMIESWKKII